MSAEVEVICRVCRRAFTYDAEPYTRKALPPPATCRPCREERAARLVAIAAKVERVHSLYVFARGTDGAVYFVGAGSLHPQVLPLHVGDDVMLAVDPLAPVEPGRRPRALRLKRA